MHEVEEDVDALFLGSVTSNREPWMVNIDKNYKIIILSRKQPSHC